jgi:hypothetical protein
MGSTSEFRLKRNRLLIDTMPMRNPANPSRITTNSISNRRKSEGQAIRMLAGRPPARGQFDKAVLSTFPCSGIVMHDFGERQKFRTHGKICSIRRFRINCEPNVPLFHLEFDNTPSRSKAIRIADKKNTLPLEKVDYLSKPLFLGCADERNLAKLGFAEVANGGIAIHFDDTVIYQLSRHRSIQRLTEWVLSNHADNEGRFGARKTLIGPVDKFCEIEKEGGLQLIFGWASRLRGSKRWRSQKLESNEDQDNSSHPVSAAAKALCFRLRFHRFQHARSRVFKIAAYEPG